MDEDIPESNVCCKDSEPVTVKRGSVQPVFAVRLVYSHHIIYEDALGFVINAVEYRVCHRYVKAIRISLRTLEKFLVASPGCLFQKFSKA